MDRILTENDLIALVPYSEKDEPDFMACWQDEETQRGYNFVLPENAEGSIFGQIEDYPFWAVAVEKCTGDKLGVLRLSPDVKPDLAIWVYPAQRGKGWGKRMYRLALEYLFSRGYEKVYAGCFPYNTRSMRILEQNGFLRRPEGDTKETSILDGSEIIMLGYVCHRET